MNLNNYLTTRFIDGGKEGGHKIPDKYDGSWTYQLSVTEVETNLDHFHPFGLPVYILENNLQTQHILKKKLQTQQNHNKWSD